MTRFGRGLVLAALAAGVALTVRFHVPVCPMAGLLGVPCPGCGLTRATLSALTGDFGGALRLHPLVFVMSPLVGWFTARGCFNYWRGPSTTRSVARSAGNERRITVAASVLVVALLGVWVARFAGYFGGPAPVERIDFGSKSRTLSQLAQ